MWEQNITIALWWGASIWFLSGYLNQIPTYTSNKLQVVLFMDVHVDVKTVQMLCSGKLSPWVFNHNFSHTTSHLVSQRRSHNSERFLTSSVTFYSSCPPSEWDQTWCCQTGCCESFLNSFPEKPCFKWNEIKWSSLRTYSSY